MEPKPSPEGLGDFHATRKFQALQMYILLALGIASM
jgi:hypothetical protein